MTLFGANGVRGIVNRDITPEVALQLGRAIGRTFQGTVAIAADARDSSPALKAGVCSGMMEVGAEVVDLGILPTPALQMYVRDHPAIAGGVMVTASHNTQEYNGLKLVLQGGIEATREDEQALDAFYSREIAGEPWSGVGECRTERGAVESYVDAIVANVDAEAIRKAKLTVCVDCANGAAGLTTPHILKRLGVDSVILGGDPLGYPRRESDPIRENLADLMTVTPAIHADFGIAHDGDGGRAIFVDGDGNYIDGDIAGALVARSILEDEKGKVATPISSSMVLQDTVEASGGLMRYTAIGSHEVVRKMIESKAVFGVEENGGMVFPAVQMCRDGGMALAKMLEIVAKGGSLAEQVAQLPVYHTVKVRVECADEAKAALLDMFVSEAQEGGYHTDMTDGLKVSCDDGWLLLRPSTTEQCFRIYSEAKDQSVAEERAQTTADHAAQFLAGFKPQVSRGSSREPRGPRLSSSRPESM
ncbi:MAG: phosphoglucosamine mutase [Thermoplasmata archaeon]|nr:phosphoglucosamine mutase [Thermoplasmata archaeon]